MLLNNLNTKQIKKPQPNKNYIKNFHVEINTYFIFNISLFAHMYICLYRLFFHIWVNIKYGKLNKQTLGLLSYNKLRLFIQKINKIKKTIYSYFVLKILLLAKNIKLKKNKLINILHVKLENNNRLTLKINNNIIKKYHKKQLIHILKCAHSNMYTQRNNIFTKFNIIKAGNVVLFKKSKKKQ